MKARGFRNLAIISAVGYYISGQAQTWSGITVMSKFGLAALQLVFLVGVGYFGYKMIVKMIRNMRDG